MTAQQIAFIKLALMVCSIACIVAVIAGCRVVDYTTPDGRHLVLKSFGTEPVIGKFTVKTAEGGEVTIENFSSMDKGLDVAAEALKRVPVVP